MKQLPFPSTLKQGSTYVVINNITHKCFIDKVEDVNELTRSFEYYITRYCPELLKDIEKYGEDCFSILNMDKMTNDSEIYEMDRYKKIEYKDIPRNYYYDSSGTYISSSGKWLDGYKDKEECIYSSNRSDIFEHIKQLDSKPADE